MADAAKALGNDAFKAGRFDEAIKHFTDAIGIDGSNHVLYSNRSAALASKGDYQAALEDADKCVGIKPDWAKGYNRKGAALQGLGQLDEAVECLEAGLKIDPANAGLNSALEDVKAKQSDNGMGSLGSIFSSPDAFAKIAANPQTAPYLQQPDFMQKFAEVQRDPKTLGQHMGDKRMMDVMGALMGINIQTASSPSDVENVVNSAGTASKATPMQVEPEPEVELTPEEKEIKEKRDAANAEKQLGNTKYKAKEFEAAIKHYTNAIEIYPDDIAYYTNRAAVRMEMKDYETAISDCREGLQVKGDFKAKAKAHARISTAYHKMGKYDEAIRAAEDSLMEDRDKQVEKKLKELQKEKAKKEKDAYLSPEKALEAREKGNEHFKAGEHVKAIECYTDAIKRDPTDHIPYSNRAACYQKVMEWALALKDCEKCVDMCPSYVKGWSRKAAVHFFLKEYHKTLTCYDEVLKLDPESQEAKDGIARTTATINAQSGGEMDKERGQRAMADPEIQAILSDPTIRKVLSDMQTDPKSAQTYLQDADIAAKLQKLIAAGVLQMS